MIPLTWRNERCCQLREIHLIKIDVKLMFLVRKQAKDAFPQLEISSAEHPFPLFACFRNIFSFGIAHLRTNLGWSSRLTNSSFLWETKSERVLQNQLVSLHCSLPRCCELDGFQAAQSSLVSNLISEWFLRFYFLSMNFSLERQSSAAELLSCRDSGSFAILHTIVILRGK